MTKLNVFALFQFRSLMGLLETEVHKVPLESLAKKGHPDLLESLVSPDSMVLMANEVRLVNKVLRALLEETVLMVRQDPLVHQVLMDKWGLLVHPAKMLMMVLV